MSAKYKGHLDRQPDGTLVWTLFDFSGWPIHGTATKDPAGGYVLSGELGPTPEGLRLPGETDMREPV